MMCTTESTSSNSASSGGCVGSSVSGSRPSGAYSALADFLPPSATSHTRDEDVNMAEDTSNVAENEDASNPAMAVWWSIFSASAESLLLEMEATYTTQAPLHTSHETQLDVDSFPLSISMELEMPFLTLSDDAFHIFEPFEYDPEAFGVFGDHGLFGEELMDRGDDWVYYSPVHDSFDTILGLGRGSLDFGWRPDGNTAY
ncbi:hypothetical protein CFIMG_003060RA [Ceratocystis fimbriata CBS 114723]|uniref:Uncharacterized protein n=1 Tax=Ceratocystis fimbriata CBS 114723 TaxID=1035309 RepID=A0A2C5XB33_9PEZI|nr:hypothetical protein CFIMG_003060RA [Ceratocystis fimbriata CBS 114723]